MHKNSQAESNLLCSICKREIPFKYIEKHHLIPKAKSGKTTIYVCHPCGSQIHKIFSNNELKCTYNTTEALLNDEKIQKWVKWIQKRPNLYVCMKTKKKR